MRKMPFSVYTRLQRKALCRKASGHSVNVNDTFKKEKLNRETVYSLYRYKCLSPCLQFLFTQGFFPLPGLLPPGNTEVEAGAESVIYE